ncbi:hypothetical protein OG21DRAFT_1524665 [Imleria badia]|nr:hypothetical protein OG21DRAFT_1524665 [Imleria badia]
MRGSRAKKNRVSLAQLALLNRETSVSCLVLHLGRSKRAEHERRTAYVDEEHHEEVESRNTGSHGLLRCKGDRPTSIPAVSNSMERRYSNFFDDVFSLLYAGDSDEVDSTPLDFDTDWSDDDEAGPSPEHASAPPSDLPSALRRIQILEKNISQAQNNLSDYRRLVNRNLDISNIADIINDPAKSGAKHVYVIKASSTAEKAEKVIRYHVPPCEWRSHSRMMLALCEDGEIVKDRVDFWNDDAIIDVVSPESVVSEPRLLKNHHITPSPPGNSPRPRPCAPKSTRSCSTLTPPSRPPANITRRTAPCDPYGDVTLAEVWPIAGKPPPKRRASIGPGLKEREDKRVISFSTGPTSQPMLWMQAFFLLKELTLAEDLRSSRARFIAKRVRGIGVEILYSTQISNGQAEPKALEPSGQANYCVSDDLDDMVNDPRWSAGHALARSSTALRSVRSTNMPSNRIDTTIASRGDAGAQTELAGATNLPGGVRGEVEDPGGSEEATTTKGPGCQAASPVYENEKGRTQSEVRPMRKTA